MVARIVGAFVLLSIMPIIIFLILQSFSLSKENATLGIYIYELCAIGVLVKKYIFETRKERAPRKLVVLWKSFWRDNTDNY